MENLSTAGSNNREVDHHGGRCNGEFQVTVEIVTLQEFSQLLESRAKKLHLGSCRERRRIQKVPSQVRLRAQQSEHLYNPIMVSLGPYHHGKPELRQAEEFKYLCLDWCARGNEEKKVVFYNKIIKEIEVIRDCYTEASVVEKYDNKALALMMVLDACIMINFMHNCLDMNRSNYLDWQNYLGAGCTPFMFRDMMLLENQIPFQVLEGLISLQYEKEEAEGFVEKFLSYIRNIDLSHVEIHGENEEPPIHFLEVYWRVLVRKHISEPNLRAHNQVGVASKFQWLRFSMREEKDDDNKFRWSRFLMREVRNNKTKISYTHRSVMDLKGKGIRIRPNSSSPLMDIKFTSHAFYGQLQLPVQPLSDLSPVIFSNLIAYEVSPSTSTSLVVLSYVIFMKSLIQSVEDVKELQEKGTLLNSFANLEKVVKLFKQIDTFGLRHQDIFMDVKHKLEEHCNSKAKTWIADLVYTRFKTPWTAIALFAAVFLLCLTFLQTFFTIRPVKWNNP